MKSPELQHEVVGHGNGRRADVLEVELDRRRRRLRLALELREEEQPVADLGFSTSAKDAVACSCSVVCALLSCDVANQTEPGVAAHGKLRAVYLVRIEAFVLFVFAETRSHRVRTSSKRMTNVESAWTRCDLWMM